MSYTVFINNEDKEWAEILAAKLEEADDFLVTGDQERADIQLQYELDNDGGKGIIIATGTNRLVLPITISSESLLTVMRLLANTASRAFEQTPYFPLMQKMVRVVGHDIRNPLNNILLATAQFKMESLPDAEETSVYIDIIERSCDRINNLMTEIVEPLSEQALDAGKVYLQDLIELAVAEFEEQMQINNISWKLEVEDNSLLLLDDKLMKVAIGHLLENAIESMRGGGTLTVKIGNTKGKPSVTILDTGSGINRDDMNKVFYPFFTTKDRKKGLGLPLARKILAAHRADIQLRSEEVRGTEATIYFDT